jgi:hypothetical protein
MDNKTLISITRVSNITLEDGCEFTISSKYQDCDYTATLKKCTEDGETLICMTLGITKDEYSETIKNQLEDFNWVHHNYRIELISDAYYLIIVIKRLSAGDGGELGTIRETILTSLRLHSSRGLRYHNSYEFRIFPPPYDQLSVALVGSFPQPFEFHSLFIDATSFLHQTEFDACMLTIKYLLEKKTHRETMFDKVLQLALAYHATSFTLVRVEHSFLILMIIFEALFKDKNENSTSNAVNRISKLLGRDRPEIKRIGKEFTQKPGFCHLRNDIAHGDITANQSLINSSYFNLYSHITRAITKLISIGANGSIDFSKDYYDEINRLINDYYQLILVNSKTAKQ